MGGSSRGELKLTTNAALLQGLGWAGLEQRHQLGTDEFHECVIKISSQV